jgi:hypothetical protein
MIHYLINIEVKFKKYTKGVIWTVYNYEIGISSSQVNISEYIYIFEFIKSYFNFKLNIFRNNSVLINFYIINKAFYILLIDF